jgi:hypothetical protein
MFLFLGLYNAQFKIDTILGRFGSRNVNDADPSLIKLKRVFCPFISLNRVI